MVGYHIDSDILASSTGETYNKDAAWLGTLLNHGPKEAKILYDLDYSVATLLAHEGITREQGKKLLDTHKLHLHSGYRLGYYQGKVFTIDYGYGAGKGYAYFYNAKQFTDVHHVTRRSIANYAIAKAIKAQEVGENVLRAYKKLGFTSQSLTSPIKAFVKSDLYPDIATLNDIPEQVGEYAYATTKGNWVECYKVGHWNTVYDYDINRAYGSQLAKLLELRDGTWVHSKAIPANRQTAPYGFAKGILTVTAPFHPFIVNTGDMSFTPLGAREEVLTLHQVDFLRQKGLGSFKVSDCLYWTNRYPEQTPKPFEVTVRRLCEASKGADPATKDVIRRILAGMWGYMLQLKGTEDDVEFGENFNPVYGAIVETENSLAVAGACLDNNVVPLSIAVDGIVTDKPLHLSADSAHPLDIGTNPGQWRLTHLGRAIIVSSGVVGIEGKGGDEDFSITYEWLRKVMEDNPEQTEYQMEKIAPVTLAKAMSGDSWDKLGQLERSTRTVYIGSESKRCYLNAPKTGGDILNNVYGSEPWDITMVTKGGD